MSWCSQLSRTADTEGVTAPLSFSADGDKASVLKLGNRAVDAWASELYEHADRRGACLPSCGFATGRQNGTIFRYEGVMMMAMSASEARKRLFPLIEQVNDDQEPVEIVSKAGTAYLVSADQWRSLMETAHLLRSPVNAERLLRSIADAEAGRIEVQELLDPQHDVA